MLLNFLFLFFKKDLGVFYVNNLLTYVDKKNEKNENKFCCIKCNFNTNKKNRL